MIVTHQRERLIESIVYFAQHTRHCGKIKLIKLLYLLDFEHFRQTGRSVTGMDYHAWTMGPVPQPIYEEWDDLGEDLAAAIAIEPQKVIDYVRECVVPRREFDPTHFSRRELRIMSELAARFRDEYSKPMVAFTHAERGPWETIWDGGKGKNERIPYLLAVAADDPNREAIMAAERDHLAVRAANPAR